MLFAAACSSGGRPGEPAARPASAGTAGPAGPAAAGTLRWHRCAEAGPGALCASLAVPLNDARPRGRTITLALSQIRATGPVRERQGVLVVNPGGPGASGLSLAGTVASQLSPRVAAEYDIVGFDPRGVGSSRPALHCDPGFFHGARPAYVPASRRAEQAMQQRARAYADDCEKRYGWLLPYMTTEDTARDIDSIRAALGQRQISYFGYSYGTYIGQVYATLFAHRLRRMVLDSTVGPRGVWWADNIDQDYAFQQRMNAFFSWTARYDGSYHLGSTAAGVRAAWNLAQGRLAAHQVQGPAATMIGPDELDDTFLEGGYNDYLWPGLAAALAAYVRTGSAAKLTGEYELYGVQDENEFAVYNAVQCSDAAWPRSWATWNAATWQVYRRAPFEAWGNAWYNAACAYWPVRAPAHPLAIRGTGLPGILMLQGSLDAATPYAGAMQAHRLLPSSRIVVVEGGGNHGQSLSYPPNTCVNGYLNRYLATGALPSSGGPGAVNATCPALPLPTPGS